MRMLSFKIKITPFKYAGGCVDFTRPAKVDLTAEATAIDRHSMLKMPVLLLLMFRTYTTSVSLKGFTICLMQRTTDLIREG